MDKILRIDMGAEGGPKATETPLGDYAGLGGRALTSAIVSGEVPPLCHPLGAENKLVIAPGLLSGTIVIRRGLIAGLTARGLRFTRPVTGWCLTGLGLVTRRCCRRVSA